MDDQALDTATTDVDASSARSTDASASTLTDEQHDWASSFCGIETRANGSGQSATAAVQPNGSVDTDAIGTAPQPAQPQSPPSAPSAAVAGTQVTASASPVDTNSPAYQQGYQDGSSGAVQNGSPWAGDALAAYDQGYQDGENAAGAEQSCDPTVDPNSPDYQAGYEDGISGNAQGGAPRDGTALAAYDEGYAAGKRDGAQGQSPVTPALVDWDHAEEEVLKEGTAIVFWHGVSHVITHVFHLVGGVVGFIISMVGELECDNRMYRFKCPTCGAIGEPVCTLDEAQEDANEHRKLYPDHLPEAVNPLSSTDSAINAGPADAGAPPADAGTPPPADAGAPAQTSVTITGPTTPAQTMKKADAERVWGIDAVATYNKAWAGGKPPPPLQAGVNLTFPTITIDLRDKGSWSFSVLNQPQFGLAADSHGVSGQAAINLFQAVWKDKYGPRLEADVQANLTNLKLDENPQFGGMAVLEFKLNDTFGVQAFLANQSDQKQGSKDFETNFSGGFQFVVHILKGPKK